MEVWIERKEAWTKQGEDARDAGDIDYARIIHSASFRRLQGKTQILNLGDSDFYRTRLTHSLEVAQIASGIVKQISIDNQRLSKKLPLPDRSLVQAIGSTHDLGHPPFGHGGEVALNYCMRKNGGFEGNGQTLRILSKLENFSKDCGANLCRRTLLGILKYPASFSMTSNSTPVLRETTSTISVLDTKKSKPPKCYLDTEEDVVQWVLRPLSAIDRELFQSLKVNEKDHHKTQYKSFDCSIMDLADDISYGVHDLEDAIAMGLLRREEFASGVQEDQCTSFLDALKAKYPEECGNDVYGHFVNMLFSASNIRKRCISRMINHFLTAVEVVELEQFEEPLLRYKATLPVEQKKFLDALKRIVRNEVILEPRVQQLEFKGQGMVVAVFEAIASDPTRLLPKYLSDRYQKSDDKTRVLCDYVAGMTDAYLMKFYERLFSPRAGSVFDMI
ncbi:hypothetical protein HY29_07365 [Hyphomonas beringensis]|uniref:Deoxyguanosinetriphosphate triphosphohydrolase-like protein n=1 Tax=Hyphomonas beringensis TaxID=1280946 RepID=A0A062U332_9PROT|nr:anti-phage deoxyguanosine triphosphatase [Hyphomonas beringensis]KCZ50575.1 hypothetical protein HY29_07365 [Hyphomonas beringensis]